MSDERVVVVAKADPTIDPIQSVVLRIEAALPVFTGKKEREWRSKAFGAYRADAESILSAFCALPQGTLDQVLMLLLERRASLLRVPVLVGKEGAK